VASGSAGAGSFQRTKSNDFVRANHQDAERGGYNSSVRAEVVQLVERVLAKDEVAGSRPVFRSATPPARRRRFVWGKAMADVVYVVTAWDENTNEDTVLVFADKAKADAEWARLDGPSVYGGVARRTVKK
jgi:hypothetical protein